jgi:MraZ protein
MRARPKPGGTGGAPVTGNRRDCVEINHPFFGHALNAVDAKGRVSVPAPFRAQVELRVKTYGVAGEDEKIRDLMVAPSAGALCLRAYDVVGQRQLVAELNESVADLPAKERREALAALRRSELGNLLPVSFDGAGRMVLPPLLREMAEITDLAYFIAVGDYFEIWSPAKARVALADDPVAVRMLDSYVRDRGAE